jgi:hypothetical protein
MKMEYLNVSTMAGLILTSIRKNAEEIEFKTACGQTFFMWHSQDCCEYVYIESVVGDLQDLVGNPLLLASEEVNKGETESEYDSQTWTFYKFATIKGYVDIRWYGNSNGYYSERVDFGKVEHREPEWSYMTFKPTEEFK